MTEAMFTPDELKTLGIYRNTKLWGLGRAVRLSVQYLISAGIFTCAAIAYQPWYTLIAYFIFVVFVVIRVIGARRLEGVMPTILTKYDPRISELEAQLESRLPSDQTPKYGAGEAGS
jgi:hypothetical protein